MRRIAWAGGAAAAIAVIVALAAHGRRPDPGLVRFQPAGVLARMPPERVGEVVVSRGDRRWRFTRTDGSRWMAAAGTPPATEEAREALERGLRFLHVSAPQRVMTREQLAETSLAELGLDPPGYTVAVIASDGEPFTIEFGGLNPQGLARYARVEGREEILLLPSFAAEPWERLTDAR